MKAVYIMQPGGSDAHESLPPPGPPLNAHRPWQPQSVQLRGDDARGPAPYAPGTSFPQVAVSNRGNILCCPRMAGGVRCHLSGYPSAALESCAPPTESILTHRIVEPYVEGARGQSSYRTLTILQSYPA